jgi:hypothetical protein
LSNGSFLLLGYKYSKPVPFANKLYNKKLKKTTVVKFYEKLFSFASIQQILKNLIFNALLAAPSLCRGVGVRP